VCGGRFREKRRRERGGGEREREREEESDALVRPSQTKRHSFFSLGELTP
jgi:hypothetical protein